MFGIAYRMLGTRAEAEDAVQDTYLRWHQNNDQEAVKNVEAYLVTITTRLCIDHLKSARVKRESYIGPWLPEPLIGAAQAEPDAQQELAETLSYAFMMLLEELNPAERAVYILREAFDFKHREIAEILDRTPEDSRQLSRRAQAHLKQQQKRFAATDEDKEQLFERFVGAASGDDLQPLFNLLAEDISAYTDGGGKVRAALRSLHGKERVSQFITRVLQQTDPDSEVGICRVNGELAIQQSLHGTTTGVITLHFVAGKVQQLFIVRNPDKLRGAVTHNRIL